MRVSEPYIAIDKYSYLHYPIDNYATACVHLQRHLYTVECGQISHHVHGTIACCEQIAT